MKTIAALRQDLDVSRGLGDIIEVLKSAAIIQFRSFQLKEKPNDSFFNELHSCLNILAPLQSNHTYFRERKELPSTILIVTSDEGFLGELNTLLINAGLDQRRSKNDEIVVLGERGAKYLEDVNVGYKFFPGFTDEINHDELEAIRGYLLKNYLEKYGRIFIVYPKFISLTAQRIEVVPFLPYEGKIEQGRPSIVDDRLLIEPYSKKVIEVIFELWAAFKMLEIFWSSKQSEYGARIMHLEGSTQELSLLNQRLAFEYFRQVHTLRDRSIREISASKVILDKKK